MCYWLDNNDKLRTKTHWLGTCEKTRLQGIRNGCVTGWGRSGDGKGMSTGNTTIGVDVGEKVEESKSICWRNGGNDCKALVKIQ